MKKAEIHITTYQRKEMLENLVDQLGNHKIHIWDDNSTYEIPYNLKKHNYFRFGMNFGKRLAWRKFKHIFRSIKNHSDYYIFLADDSELCDDFINKAIRLYESINDPKKICLSFSHPDRCKVPNFNGIKPIDKGNVIKTQWTDLTFICEHRFFQEVEVGEVIETRWLKDPYLGSGVGSMISTNFLNKGYNLYNVKEEMIRHLGDISLMNPQREYKLK